MEFELKYELDNFKEVQDQYFDEDNKCYTGVNLSTDIMEKMLSLIDNLSERVNELEPVIKQQIKKSLPIHGVVERLPIGEIIKLIDNEYFKGFTGELKITGHCSYMGKKVGHLVNGEGIFLIEDFVR